MSAMRMHAAQSSLFRVQGGQHGVRNLACLAILTFAAVSVGAAQPATQEAAAPQPVQQPAQQSVIQAPNAAAVPVGSRMPLNPQTPQQKQLAADTAKLLQLANELKAEMDKSTKDTLSLSVVKKAEQVEKLAHKVRDEMKASIGN